MSDQPLPDPSTQTLPGAKEYGVSDCCLKGNQFEGEPKGKMVKLGGFDVYVATPAPREGKESRGIVLFSDIFGLGIKNPKIISDELALRLGVTVYCPDYFEGRHVPESVLIPFLKDTPTATSQWKASSIFSKIKDVIVAVPNLPNAYSIVKGTDARMVKVEKFLRDLRQEKKLTHLGVIGFCAGGIYAILAANIPGLLQTVIVAHPGPVADDKCTTGIKIPSSWIFSEEDDSCGIEKQETIIAHHKAHQPEGSFESHRYMGTVHGFASRPALHVPEVKKAFEQTLDQQENWFRKFVVDAE
ncbi:dienelactone hydrolase [Mrakia frigida]|uniref:dienelactone hydrolase family protein n=1 Tax=Mrakia frigida TaxID=29902 RepID=UPI003FCC0687